MEPAEPGVETEPASPIARVVFAVLAVLLLALAFGSDPLFRRISEWIAADPDLAMQRVEQFIAWIAVASLPLLVGAVFTFRSGLQTIAAERFPPPGMWLLVATPIVKGNRAKWRGRMLLIAAALMMAIAVGLPAGLWYIIHAMVEAA